MLDILAAGRCERSNSTIRENKNRLKHPDAVMVVAVEKQEEKAERDIKMIAICKN